MAYKTNFEYHAPVNLAEALELAARYGSDCKVIAGGTDLIPKIKSGLAQFGHLISLKNVAELRRISFDPQNGLTLGAGLTLAETEKDPNIARYYPALRTGIHCMANTQIRNRGTVVGNICNAVPSADTAPALLVYGARIRLASASGERAAPIGAFFTGVGRTVLAPDELVTGIFLPLPEPGAFSEYIKYSIRKALDLAMIGVAVNLAMGADKTVHSVRIALGAVAATPRYAATAEALLLGKPLTEDRIEAAALAASREDCAPISDIRATAEYRREMVRIYLRDVLRKGVNAK
jgi:carbon-monoxide dehydrogenase medium subunit